MRNFTTMRLGVTSKILAVVAVCITFVFLTAVVSILQMRKIGNELGTIAEADVR